MKGIRSIAFITLSFLLVTVFLGCRQKTEMSKSSASLSIMSNEQSFSPNRLTVQEQEEGWELLFDGESTEKWRKVYGETFPSDGWIVENGTLTVLESDGRQGGRTGSIVTKEQYSDFELQLDFKLTKGANSGIKYFVIEDPDFFEGNPSGSGIGLEYQIIDDENWPEKLNNDQTLGSLYVLIPAAQNKKVNPIGEWNQIRLVSKANHVEHWLNGEKVLEYERGGDTFRELVAKSKYNRYKNFGLASKGHILLQDHGTRVSFRSIKVRELD